MSTKIDLANLLANRGIQTDNINAKKILIEKEDGKTVIIESPSVARTKFFGMDVLLVLGNIKEEGK